MTEPTERDLHQVDRLIDAAHQEIDQQAGTLRIDITWYEHDSGRRFTFDYDQVAKLMRYADGASQRIGDLTAGVERFAGEAKRYRRFSRAAVCTCAAVLGLFAAHIALDFIGGKL